MCNMERIGLTASEKMSFENVNGRRTDGRTPDACVYHKLTYGELKRDNYYGYVIDPIKTYIASRPIEARIARLSIH